MTNYPYGVKWQGISRVEFPPGFLNSISADFSAVAEVAVWRRDLAIFIKNRAAPRARPYQSK